MRVRFQESPGGWGNPLRGKVFDSEIDLKPEETPLLQTLLDRCQLRESIDTRTGGARDLGSYDLTIEADDRTVCIRTDPMTLTEPLKSLVDFLRARAKPGPLK